MTKPTNQALHVWDMRAIRERLAAMGLDWDAPPLPPAPPVAAEPLRIQVERGNLPPWPAPVPGK